MTGSRAAVVLVALIAALAAWAQVFAVPGSPAGTFQAVPYAGRGGGAPPCCTYYSDSVSGSDSNAGTLAAPFANAPGMTNCAANCAAVTLAPGQSVGLKAGSLWRQALTVGQSGTAGNPVAYANYGIGASPVINGANLVTGSWTQLNSSASGSVTQANMKMSLVNGAAFADFGVANALTGFIGDLLTITDSAGKHLTGYIKAAGTGETYGAELHPNPGMDTPASFTTQNATLAAVASPCLTGNCLQVTLTAGFGNGIAAVNTTTSGMLTVSQASGRRGTETGQMYFIVRDGANNAMNVTGNIGSAAYVQSTLYATSTIANPHLLELYQNQTSGLTALWDTASVRQVLTPSVTGVTITSTAGGSTFNWASEDAGFNRNDSANYTYSISGLLPVWQITLATQPFVVAVNGAASAAAASVAAITGPNQWFWATSLLSVYSVTNPTTAFTSPGVEAGTRAIGIDLNSKSFVTLRGIEVRLSNGPGIADLATNPENNVSVLNCTLFYNSRYGIGAFTTSSNWVISGNTVTGNGGIARGLAANDNLFLVSPTGTGTNFTLTNNNVSNAYGDGVVIAGSGHTISGNTFANNGDGGAGYGIEILGSNTSVINNIVSGSVSTYAGIDIIGGAGNSVVSNTVFGNLGNGIACDAGTVNVYYNTIYSQTVTNAAGILIATGGCNVYHNTLYNNYTGIQTLAAALASNIRNNLITASPQLGYGYGGTATVTFGFNDVSGSGSANYFGISDQTGISGNISADPLFVNPAGGNFNLQAGSPAIGKGVFIPGVSTANPPNMGAK